MSTVLKVRDEKLKIDAVVKLAPSNSNRELFEREARLMLGLDPHPNVVGLFEVARLRGRPLIVMDFYPERDLSHWIGAPRLIADVPLVIRLALQICDAMLHVQRCGIAVHGDIKPRNVIMINREAVGLCDFGLAAAHNGPTGGGTPGYIAPEIETTGASSERSDIYSFGATLFEMLAGKPAHAGRSSTPLAESRRKQREQSQARIAGISECLQQVVSDCLATDPAGRPPTFAAVRERLGSAYTELVGIDPPAPLGALDVSAWDWTMRGRGMCALGRHQEETAYHRRALELDPTLAAAHSNLADNLRELRLFEEALVEADRALAIDPDLPNALDIKGSVLDELGDAGAAESQYRKAIDIDPDYAWAWYNLGLVLQNQGRLQEAIDSYKSVLRLQPQNAQAWTNLGCILADHEAEECYRTALTHEPCLNEAIANLGTLLQRQGRHREAIELFDKVEKECG